jgi:hypothetical protein
VSQPFWSRLERGLAPAVSIETLASCAAAVNVQLAAFIEARPGAGLPRDIEHLRRQELVIEFARAGRWTALPESAIDADAARSRSVDVLLSRMRGAETIVVEVVDLLADAGAAVRGLADKVAAVRRTAPPDGRVAGLFVLRATTRNRTTVRELANVFESRFPAPSSAWLKALRTAEASMPPADGIIWSSVDGKRLFAVRRDAPRRSP